MTLDPTHLTPAASLNRVRIVDLPGIALDDAIRGNTAYDLLAARTLAEDVRRHVGVLGLDVRQGSPDTEILLAFAHRFEAHDPTIHTAADAISRRYGRSLGALILTLKRGDAINREARPDWDGTYWDYWAGIDAIWLGGGVVSGELGERVRHHAVVMLAEDKAHTCALNLAAHPSFLPLIGAARSVPQADKAALVFDFGQSTIKRALALYDRGELTALRLLPPLPAPATFSTNGDLTLDQVRDLADRMAAAMGETWQGVTNPDRVVAPLLVASIASYEVDGQPLPRQGGPYSQLQRLSDNAARWLAYQVGRRVGRPLDVVLIHDGTAAARVYAGKERTAVIMLGTALGVGFAPPATTLTPVAPHLIATQELHH